MKKQLISIIKRFQLEKLSYINAVTILSVVSLVLFITCIVLTILVCANKNKYTIEKAKNSELVHEAVYWQMKYYDCSADRMVDGRTINYLNSVIDNYNTPEEAKEYILENCETIAP